MFQVLTDNILPVFALLAIGFGLGRANIVSIAEAKTLNRIAFLVLQPALLYLLLTGIDLFHIRWSAIAIYAVCEVLAFFIAFTIARRVFRIGPRESALLGMTVVFVNSLLYVWPISVLMFGETGAIPISVIVAMDAAITFSIFIIWMELTSGGGLKPGLRRIALNPVLLTMLLALLVNLIGIPTPKPLDTGLRFAGAATAPLMLFALGVVLSSHPARPSPVILTYAGLKLFVLPAMVFAGFALWSPGNAWAGLYIMNAAGPSGAMAFSLALLYNVRTENIAPVIIWTSVLSLFSLAYLA